MNKYLPLGTIVSLKDATKKMMIIGYDQKSKTDPNLKFDYAAVLYPYGLLMSDQIGFFNRDKIDKVISEGYSDEESKELFERVERLKEYSNN